jgi:hypothetical protein
VFHLIKTLGFQLQIAPAKNVTHLSWKTKLRTTNGE